MKKIQSFVTKKEKEIATAYESVTAYAEYITFLEAAVKDYHEKGTEKFYSTFEEFGQTFTTEYDAAGILTGMATYSYWQAAVGFAANPDQQGYHRLLNALHYNIQALLKCEQQQKIEESIFSTDIALYIILATIYFPKDVAPLLQYFSFYIKTKKELMDARIYADLLGKTDVIPLMIFVTTSAGVQLPDDHIKHYVHADIAPAYRKAMDQLYSEDPAVVTAWINEMVNDHIAKSKDNWTLAFNHLSWQHFPVEIIALLVMRARKGLSNDFIDNPLLNHFKPFLAP